MTGIFTSFHLEIYPFTVYLSVGQSDEDFLTDIIDHELILSSDYLDNKTNWGMTWMSSCAEIIIRLRTFPETPEDEGNVAHEAFHATCDVMNSIGTECTEATKEPYAYLLGYIVKKIKEAINNRFERP